ncbi:MAG: DUF4349 domain-containing protein [Lachnospiraceae bacterium]|nr:DUF4349 domain-containing protein [Lachnospiraceae bacterium]
MIKSFKKLLMAGFICSLILTGCGGSADTGSYRMSDEPNYAADSYDAATEEAYEGDYSYDDVEAPAESSAASGIDIQESTPSVTAKQISTEKLIYTCNLSIDTLDFDETLKSLAALIEKNDGFIENEEYSDGNSYDLYSYYYVEDNTKHDQYTATIRIPSDKYKTFLNDAESLGDIRSKNANVENVSQEYSDLNVSLEIYEAAYDRYMKLLEEATDEDYALELQQKITDTQVEIARIKTRLNKIDTDVSYSFVNISIREVTKYDEKPLPKDTFGQRLISEIKETAEGFLGFLENLLFIIIHLIPYLALIAIIIFIITKIRKKMGKTSFRESIKAKQEAKKAAKAAKRSQAQTPESAPAQTTQTDRQEQPEQEHK